MSWLCRDSELVEEDLETLSFEPQQSRVFVLERKDGATDITKEWSLTTDAQWQKWLDQTPIWDEKDNSSRINLILGGRAVRSWGHDPSLLSKLPWSNSIFLRMKSKLLVHGCIVRAINRSASCTFSHLRFSWPLGCSTRRSIVYNCRSAASWPQDMALSVTFFPETLTTNAIIFGLDMHKPDLYDQEMTLPDIIVSRLSHSDIPVCHPMLLPVMFADMERDRQVQLVRRELEQLGQRVAELNNLVYDPPPFGNGLNQESPGNGAPCISTGTAPQTGNARKPTSELWQNTSRLKLGLENWKCQLEKMIHHVEELNVNEFARNQALDEGKVCDSIKRRHLHDAGIIISNRLQELVDEYNEHIRECTHIMDGMTLATQLELSNFSRIDSKTNQEISQVNLDVARMTRQDGRLMKSIAFLGMIFLPATLVTAIFSMDFFDWAHAEETVSSDIWIYIVAVVAVTVVTVGAFYFCVQRRWKIQDSREIGGEYSAV